LKQSRTSDLDKFEELMAQYEALEKVVEEDKSNKIKIAEEERMLKIKVNAVIKLQHWWLRILKKRAEAQAAKAASKKSAKGKKKK
jgi:hypothetical protein